MSKLSLSLAIGDYDRHRPLVDGAVRIDGVDPVFMLLEPEEIFFRALRHAEFDICELSLSSYTVKTARDDCPYVGVPVFPSRAFRHTAFTVRTDRIRSPSDLKGKRVGLPEYQLTANVWGRAILEEEYGVKPSDIQWLRGGIEQTGREEKIALTLPADVSIEDIGPDQTLSQMLTDGEIDAILSPRAPSCFERGEPNIGWLFEDPTAVAADYYRRTGVFPIMHILGVRKSIVADNPWLPVAVMKAFSLSKTAALHRLADTSATKITLPFVEEQLKAVRALMGDDFWSFGAAANRPTLETFLRHHHAQGLSPRRLAVEELFHPSTLETVRI